MKRHLKWAVWLLLLGTACDDLRRDQRDDNLFNPSDAFIRFDFGNAVNSVAKDSVLLLRGSLDSIAIPVALSAASQTAPVSFRFVVKTLEGNMIEGIHFELRTPEGALPADKMLQLAPGQYVQLILFKELSLPESGAHRLRLELTDVSPGFIHLGFPVSGRSRFFDLLYTP